MLIYVLFGKERGGNLVCVGYFLGVFFYYCSFFDFRRGYYRFYFIDDIKGGWMIYI